MFAVMDMTEIPLKVPPEMLAVLDRLAVEQDVTVGHLIRETLDAKLSKKCDARPPVRADERLVATMRARLAPIFGSSTDWQELEQKLHAEGYELRPAGGELALHSWPEDVRLCKTCLLYTSPSPRDQRGSRMPSSA